jgi:hypothetical protein
LKNANELFGRWRRRSRKNERQDETGFTTKTDGFLSFIPPLNANELFGRWRRRSRKMKDRMKLGLPPKLMVF